MFRVYFILFLIAHILGDFYLQNSKMAKKKMESIKWVFLHVLCHWSVMLVIYLPMMSWEYALGVTIVAILHCFIDIVKNILYKKWKHKITQVLDRNLFFIDQSLHITILIGISYWLAINKEQLILSVAFVNFFQTIGIAPMQILTWILAILIIHKPANIAISKLLMIYRPVEEGEGKKRTISAGMLIGTLERMLMLIFLIIGQYPSIGLVLTAKSIARYDRITKERDFAEYYLLGTLMSTVVAIIVSIIF